MSVTIYHNPRCSKSRQTMALLEGKGIEAEVIEYLKTPPSADELATVVGKLGLSVRDILRTGEDEYKNAADQLGGKSDAELLDWLSANPRVIQRPIVITADAARIGRPPESVLEIL